MSELSTMTEKVFNLRKAVAEILPGCVDCISRQVALNSPVK